MSISRAFRNARLAHTLNFLDAKTIEESVDTSGNTGDIIYDNNFVYIKTTDGWKRASISSFTGFSPNDISGLQLWLDASDASTLYDATTGGSLVAADGGVARWEDKSGNNRHATQGTAGSRPLRKAGQMNGFDALYYDGSTSTGFEATITGARNFSSMTMFFVIKPAAEAAADSTTFASFRYPVDGSANGQDELAVGFATGSLSGETFALMLPPSSARRGSSTYQRAANTTTVLSIGLGSGGTVLYANGSAVSLNLQADAQATNNAPGSALVRSSDLVYIGSNGVTPEQTYGECIIYNSALSDTDREAVENYLMTKWGIS